MTSSKTKHSISDFETSFYDSWNLAWCMLVALVLILVYCFIVSGFLKNLFNLFCGKFGDLFSICIILTMSFSPLFTLLHTLPGIKVLWENHAKNLFANAVY